MGTTRICPSCGDRISGTIDRCPNDGIALFSDEIMARVGMLLKDHEIQGVVGEGGMGVVYRARHIVLEKPVAIKVLHERFARQKEMVEQFIIEAKAASRIRHPNIIDVTDFGTTPEGMVFLVMEYLDGESLEDRLQRVGRLPLFDAVNIVKQIAQALAAVHALGIIHRDLKPANIFLCEREGRRRIVRRTMSEAGLEFSVEPEDTFDLVKLVDFGVAKFMDLGPSAATRAGVVCGSPHYLSPEQAQEKPATERSDIYALGAVFYEMVTGSVPFEGDSMLEILNGHVAGRVIVPSQRAPDAGIDAHLDAVILKCLEKEPARRFASADELGEALHACVTDRAFLRDAYLLPGISSSGIDLGEASPSARRGSSSSDMAVEDADAGFNVVEAEDERAMAGFASPDGGFDAVDRDLLPLDDTTAILHLRRARTVRLAILVVVLLAGASAAVWALRVGRGREAPEQSSFVATTPATKALPPPSSHTNLLPAPAPSAPAPPAPSSAAPSLPAPSAPAPSPLALPSTATSPGATALALAPTGEQAKGLDPGPGKTAPPRTQRSGSARKPASWPWPPESAPYEPAPLAPVPSPAPAPVAAAPSAPPRVDVEALLREAQQAWTRRYYAVAIDKARAVLKAEPGRHTAYQIIAASSCALGDAAEARQAIAHLDEDKRKLVRSLCARNGVILD